MSSSDCAGHASLEARDCMGLEAAASAFLCPITGERLSSSAAALASSVRKEI